MVHGSVEGREEPVAPRQDVLRQEGEPRLVVAREDATPQIHSDHHRRATDDPEQRAPVPPDHGVRTRPVPEGFMRPPSTTTAPLMTT